MRKAVNEMATELEVGEIHTKGEDWGGQLVRHIDLPPGADFTPLFRACPATCASAPTGATSSRARSTCATPTGPRT